MSDAEKAYEKWLKLNFKSKSQTSLLAQMYAKEGWLAAWKELESKLAEARNDILNINKTLNGFVDDLNATRLERDRLKEALINLKNLLSKDGDYSFCMKNGGKLGFNDAMIIGKACDDADTALSRD